MAIDNPIDALKQQFEMEDLSVSPVTKGLLRVATLLPLGWPINKAIELLTGNLAAQSLERYRLLLETCCEENGRQQNEIAKLRETLTPEQLQARAKVAVELLLDAARKAESTRARDRVKRIGLIFANAIVEPGPVEADEVEEMMRVAMELGDHDIKLLAKLVRIEGPMLETRDHIPRYDAYLKWEDGSWGNHILPEVESGFSKLESYGLVSRLAPPNNLNITADFQHRYVLLKKGMRFVTLIRETAVRAGT
jgi:hypothetical protein